MTNEEMFMAIMGRLDSLENRMDRLETKVDTLQENMEMEFKAVRTEMDVAYKTLKQDIFVLNDKVDRLVYLYDADGHEKMKLQVELLTRGYQELKEKIS